MDLKNISLLLSKHKVILGLLILVPTACIILCVLIYYDYPPIGDIQILKEETSKINLIIILTSLCILTEFLLVTTLFKYKKEEFPSDLFPNIESDIKTITGNHKYPLYQLPWYLEVAQNSTPHPTKNDITSAETENKIATYRVDNNGVFFEISNSTWIKLLTDESAKKNWLEFIDWIVSKRKRRPLNGIILTLDDEYLLKQKSNYTKITKDILLPLYQRIGNTLALYIINKSKDSYAVNNELIGITFSAHRHNSKHKDAEYKLFLAKTAKSITSEAMITFEGKQPERNIESYIRIKQFIGQGEAISSFANELTDNKDNSNNINPRGIYFENDNIHSPNPEKHVFISSLNKILFFEKGLTKDGKQYISEEKKQILLSYLQSGVVIAILSALLFFAYQKGIGQIYKDLSPINKTSEPPTNSASEILKKLNALKSQIETNEKKTTWESLLSLKMSRDEEVLLTLKKKYEDSLNNQLLSIVVNNSIQFINNILDNESNDDQKLAGAIGLFTAIESTINKHNNIKLDNKTIEFLGQESILANAWLHRDINIKKITDIETQHLYEQTKHHFRYLLDNNTGRLPDKQAFELNKIKVKLAQRPLAKRLTLQMDNQAQTKLSDAIDLIEKNLISIHDSFGITNEQALPISPLFTKAGFSQIYLPAQQILPNLIQFDLAIFNDSQNPPNDKGEVEFISKEVERIYSKEYINEWQTLIDSINPPTPKSTEDLLGRLKHYSTSKDPYRTLLDLVNKNTNLRVINTDSETIKEQNTVPQEQTTKNAATIIQDHFQHINKLIDPSDTSKPKLTDMEAAFSALFDSLADAEQPEPTSETTKDGNENAAKVLINLSNKLPSPLDKQIREIANASLHATINLNIQRMDEQWQQDVFNFYIQKIKGRYPLVKSGKDISLTDFQLFFSPTGMIENFRKKLDATLSGAEKSLLSEDFLSTYEHVNYIRAGFFGEGNDPKLKFSIEPISISNTVAKSILQNADNSITFTGQKFPASEASWPTGDDSNSQSLLIMTPRNNRLQKEYIQFTGVWSIFRLFDRSKTIALNNNIREVQFTGTNGTADYKLTSTAEINPITQNLFDGFNLPSSIFNINRN